MRYVFYDCLNNLNQVISDPWCLVVREVEFFHSLFTPSFSQEIANRDGPYTEVALDSPRRERYFRIVFLDTFEAQPSVRLWELGLYSSAFASNGSVEFSTADFSLPPTLGRFLKIDLLEPPSPDSPMHVAEVLLHGAGLSHLAEASESLTQVVWQGGEIIYGTSTGMHTGQLKAVAQPLSVPTVHAVANAPLSDVSAIVGVENLCLVGTRNAGLYVIACP